MTITLRVQGLDCAEEATALRGTVGKLPGVAELSFDVLRGMMIVEFDPAALSDDRILQAVAKTGMRAQVVRETGEGDDSSVRSGRRWKSLVTMSSGIALGLALIVHGLMSGWRTILGAEDHNLPLLATVLFCIC